MNTYEVKNYLKQYRLCMARVFRLRGELEKYSASADSISAEIARLLKKAEEIEALIEKEENMLYREVLMRKYVYGETFEEIGERLCYSSRHIQRLLNRAVERVALLRA